MARRKGGGVKRRRDSASTHGLQEESIKEQIEGNAQRILRSAVVAKVDMYRGSIDVQIDN